MLESSNAKQWLEFWDYLRSQADAKYNQQLLDNLRLQYSQLKGLPYIDTEQLSEEHILMGIHQYCMDERLRAAEADAYAGFRYFARPRLENLQNDMINLFVICSVVLFVCALVKQSMVGCYVARCSVPNDALYFLPLAEGGLRCLWMAVVAVVCVIEVKLNIQTTRDSFQSNLYQAATLYTYLCCHGMSFSGTYQKTYLELKDTYDRCQSLGVLSAVAGKRGASKEDVQAAFQNWSTLLYNRTQKLRKGGTGIVKPLIDSGVFGPKELFKLSLLNRDGGFASLARAK